VVPSKRSISALLTLALAVLGVASQIHTHGFLPSGPEWLSKESKYTGPVYAHTCLACKLSHTPLDTAKTYSSYLEAPLSPATASEIPGFPLVVSVFTPASPRAPPAVTLT
jgi:hypothetical protein